MRGKCNFAESVITVDLSIQSRYAPAPATAGLFCDAGYESLGESLPIGQPVFEGDSPRNQAVTKNRLVFSGQRADSAD
jgi:hypothetical protein